MKLIAQGIDVGYAGTDELVLRHLDISIEEGESVALVGPNGSGKSTLLRALARVLKPKSGTVLLDGRSIVDWSTRDVARRLALLPQGPTLSDDLTTAELIALGRSPHQGWLGLPTVGDREAVTWAASETSVSGLMQRPVRSLSGGERQRVWLAMALAQRPQLLLLDEPTTFLDLNHQLEVLELVSYLNREHGLTVVMVLHDLNQAARYASRVVVMREGAIHCQGAPAEVLTADTLRDVFGVEGCVMAGPEGVGMVIVPVGRVK